MHKLFLTFLFSLILIVETMAQVSVDRASIGVDISFSTTLVKATETIYSPLEITESNSPLYGFGTHLQGVLPLIKKPTWSTGLIVSGGLNFQFGRNKLEGFEYAILEFPTYIYYRNYAKKHDFSINLGLKKAFTLVTYTQPIIALDTYLDDYTTFRIYSTLIPTTKKIVTRYDELELRFFEIGIASILLF